MKRELPPWIWSLVALVLLLVYNAIFTPGFFHLEIRSGHLYGSLIDVLRRSAPVAVISLGMALVIATRGVDLSVGAIAAIAGELAARFAIIPGTATTTIFAIALGASLLCGLWNGVLVAFFDIQPIVATLVLMVAGRGIAQLVYNGQNIQFDNRGLSFFARGYLFGMPFSFTVVILCLLACLLLVRGTALGLFIESVGDNPVAGRFTGIPVRTVLIFAYAVTGVLSGVAGLLIAAETQNADANHAGLYIELDAILAVVLGGTSLNGGRFYLFGAIVGSLLIQSLTTTILTKGISPDWTLVVKAIIILAVCLLQAPSFRRWFSLKKVPAA